MGDRMIVFYMLLAVFFSFCLGWFACATLTAAKISDLEADVWELNEIHRQMIMSGNVDHGFKFGGCDAREKIMATYEDGSDV